MLCLPTATGDWAEEAAGHDSGQHAGIWWHPHSAVHEENQDHDGHLPGLLSSRPPKQKMSIGHETDWYYN